MHLIPAASEFGKSTILICLLFGTNFFLFVLFQLVKSFSKVESNELEKKNVKKLSKPFTGSLTCFTTLTEEIFRTGLIMTLTYMCEKHWIFDHSKKYYSRDTFLFVVLLFFIYAFYTIKPVKDLSLLGREQTEEWKGWMQFIFLLYHYFHAEEVYNSVRVMITCYVWMTGFGNFSFFFVKQDFGWLRLAQMMWRLNFSVLLLMWTHGNTYILYYICPLHTFYFLMVFVTMYCFSSLNHSKWGIRWKLLLLGILIYLVWDINQGSFDVIFSWLGTDKVIGANSGSVYEYYFRTSLDHYSTFFGMIFAVNYPLAEQFFKKAQGTPLILTAVLIGGLTVWWLVYCYPLDKLTYNLTHSYYAIIPLTSYIFFRNITPGVRSGVSMGLHELGKTTLETYLLQHHIWLTSNAKTLLTIIPGHPWVNFIFASILFVFVARELYRLTMSLRGMVLPDDKDIAFKNLIGAFVLICIFAIIAAGLFYFEATLLEIWICCMILAILIIFIISKTSQTVSDNELFKAWSKRLSIGLVIMIALSLIINFTSASSTKRIPVQSLPNPSEVQLAMSSNSDKLISCVDKVSKGHWIREDCLKTGKIAYCKQFQWVWDPSDCAVKSYSTGELKSQFKGKKVAFIGDSQLRLLYHEFNSLLDPSYSDTTSAENKHQDLSNSLQDGISVSFQWAPYLRNITDRALASSSGQWDVVVAGGATWDALHIQDLSKYKAELTRLKSLDGTGLHPLNIWIEPPTVKDSRLEDEDKQKHMNENTIAQYRQAFREAGLTHTSFHSVIDPAQVTGAIGGPGGDKDEWTVDGVHFSKQVYQVVTQMIVNSYSLYFPPIEVSKETSKASYKPRKTGSMSMPLHGLVVLLLATVMLFLMDSFLGFGFLALALFGRSNSWEEAYGPLLKKVLGTAAVVEDKIKEGEGVSELEMVDEESEKRGLLDLERENQTKK